MIARGKVLAELAKNKDSSTSSSSAKDGKKSSKAKRRGGDDDDDEDEGGDDDEEGGEDEEDEGDGDGDGDDDEEVDEEFCIRRVVERKKQEALDALKELDPSLRELEQDTLDLEATDWDMKMTPLHYAAFFGNVAVIKLLVDAGASPSRMLSYDLSNKTATFAPLTLTLFNNHAAAARMLLTAGAPIDQRDNLSRTPLHLASAACNLDFVRLLCEGGASVTALDRSFHTALNHALAEAHRYPEDEAEEADNEYETEEARPNTEDQKRVSHFNNNRRRKRRGGNTAAQKARDPIPPHQWQVINSLVVEFDAPVLFDKQHMPPAIVQQQLNLNFGGGSQREQLRNRITQPIMQAVQLESPSVVQLLLEFGPKEQLQWINNSTQTALDLAQNALDSIANEYIDYQFENATLRVQTFTKQLATLNKAAAKSKRRLLIDEVTAQLAESQAQLEQLDTREESLKQEEARKYRQKQLTEIVRLLSTNGCLSFYDMRLTGEDAALKPQQKNDNRRHGRNTWYRHKPDPPSEIKLGFSGIRQRFANNTRVPERTFSDAEALLLEQLYDSILNEDVGAVESLTVKRPVGSQAHVCVKLSSSSRSPLHFAARINAAELAERLVEIAIEQYTPLVFKDDDADKEDKVLAINNYELMRLAGTIRPGEFLSRSGAALSGKTRVVDPNSPQLLVNCITSPEMLLGHQDSQQRNVFHTAALHGADDVARVLCDLVIANKWKDLPESTDTTDAKKAAAAAKVRDLLPVLLGTRDSNRMTPFELAIARGNVSTAAVLLRYGGLAVEYDLAANDDDDAYEGLDVGGKKMDWALEHRAPAARKFSRNAAHIAAAYNQPASIEFLATRALEIWNTFYAEARKAYSGGADHDDDDDDDEDWSVHFALDATDEKGRTPLVYAATAGATAACCKILEYPTGVATLHKASKAGNTPLHFAVSFGRLETVGALLAAKADVGQQDFKRGWSALHFAAYGNDKAITEQLLEAATPEQARLVSLKFKQCPLAIAAYYGSLASLAALLAPKAIHKIDLLQRDCCGDFALHLAVRQGHAKAVRILLEHTSKPESYQQENGLGLSVLDYAMHAQTTHFFSQSCATPANRLAVYRSLLETVGDARKFASFEDVRGVTYLMLTLAEQDVEREAEEKAQRQRSYYTGHGRSEDSSYDGDFTHEPNLKGVIFPELKL